MGHQPPSLQRFNLSSAPHTTPQEHHMATQLTCGQHFGNFFKEIPLTCSLICKPFKEYPAGCKGLMSCSQEDNKAALSAWLLVSFHIGIFDIGFLVIAMVIWCIEMPSAAGLIIAGFMGAIIIGVFNAFLWTHVYHYWLIRHDACCCGGEPNPILWLILGVLAIIGGAGTVTQNLGALATHWTYIFTIIGNIIHGVPLFYIGVLEIKIWQEKKGGGGGKVAPSS